MLKQIRKKNPTTNQNIQSLIEKTENTRVDLEIAPLNLFTFIQNLKLSTSFLF